MFDKIDISTIINIDKQAFDILLSDELNNIKHFTNIDNQTGEIHNTYIIYDNVLSYVKYNDRSKRLFISLSIPKLLYGNNIKEIDERDIEAFFSILQNRLNELLNVSIPSELWKVNEVEVSKNFKLDSQRQVTDYINKLSNIKLPRKTTHKYNSESVYYQNKSQTIKFYDKFQEMKKQKGITPELLKEAENILRFEVQAQGYLLREYSSDRKAIELLTKDFFESVTTEIIDLINSKVTTDHESIITPIIFESGMNNNQIESAVAIMIFINEMGEATVKEIYSPNTLKRKKDNLKDLIQYVQQRQSRGQELFLKL